MADTPKLTMPEISAAQASKEVTHNAALRDLDCLVQATAIDRDLTAPPGSPTDGATYLVGAGATGAWATHDNEIAYYESSAWSFHAPAEGWKIYLVDENKTVLWNGSTWVEDTSSGYATFTGLTDTPANYTDASEKYVRVNTAADALEYVEAPYDIAVFFPDKPGGSEVIFRMPFVRDVDFAAAFASSQAKAGIAATAEAIFSLEKNGSQIGTMTFAISGTTATFAGAGGSLTAGDILTVVAPASQDATLAAIGFTLKGKRG